MPLSASFKALCRRHAPGLTACWRIWLRSRWVEAWRGLPAEVTLYDGVRRRLTVGLRNELARWKTFEFDKELQAVFAAYTGGDVVDIGGSQGAYCVVLAPKAAPGDRFLVLEPDAAAFPTLLKNLATLASAFPHVEFLALKLAAGDGQGMEVSYPAGTTGHPCFATRALRPGERGSLVVDDLVAALQLRPRLIKVDVEGAEFAVLQGLVRTLTKVQPVLCLETHPDWLPPGVCEEDIRQLLIRSGYRVSQELDTRHQLWLADSADTPRAAAGPA